MRHPNGSLIDSLAAEYVLGTLRGAARDRFERWLHTGDGALNAGARDAVRRWEDRLVHLVRDLQPVDPAPRLWRDIERRIGLAPARNANKSGWLPWAVAAGLALLSVGLWRFSSQEPAFEWQLSAQLRERPEANIAWQVDIDRQRGRIRLQASASPALAADRAHELWALPGGDAAPVSLGLLPRAGAAERDLTPSQRAALTGTAKLAVSIEPAGGSPVGAPTGPVILVADWSQSTPG